MSTHLPLPAIKAGGAIVNVLSWEQHAVLSSETRYGIAKLVQQYPELNTEADVDFIANWSSYHGLEFGNHLAELAVLHGPVNVDRAINYLNETGHRAPGDQKHEDIITMIDALDNLAAVGLSLNIPEQIEPIVIRLGGFGAVADMSIDEIKEKLNHYSHIRYGEVPDREAYY